MCRTTVSCGSFLQRISATAVAETDAVVVVVVDMQLNALVWDHHHHHHRCCGGGGGGGGH